MIDPLLQKKVIDLADFVARIGAGVAALWVSAVKVWKPLSEWRRKLHNDKRVELAGVVRDILGDELRKLQKLSSCADRIEIVLRRQSVLFEDVDRLLSAVSVNKERIDETNDLLDAMGFTSGDRRVDEVLRVQFQHMIEDLRERQRSRKRAAAEELEAHARDDDAEKANPDETGEQAT
jgi:hypothetical protein